MSRNIARRRCELEREITELTSHIHAATCRWLGLVAEYDRREGWGHWGCLSCAHWVSWQCGISLVAAREHVRVARRLEQLPLIQAAFAEGRLSYSKVRAITRVDGIVREAELLELALHATASQLDRLVRAYRGAVAVEQAARGGRPERWLTFSHDDDGALLLHARLPAEEGALVLAALDGARDQLAAERLGSSDAAAPLGPPERRDAPAEAPTGPARIEAGKRQDTPAEAPTGSARAAAREPQDTPAEAPTGSARTAAREPQDTPAEAPTGSDPATAHERRDASAEAPARSAGEARADALLLVCDSFLAHGATDRTAGDRYQVVVHVDDETIRDRERGGRCELDTGAPLAPDTARRLACDAAIVPLLEHAGKPVGVGRKTRSIPPALRRALAARDRGCRFPGCHARRFVDAHHISHWADGGPTDLSNLVHLCHAHHRLLHEGGYTVTAGRDGALSFRGPDGRRLPDCPTPPAGRTAGLRARRPGQPLPAVAPDACLSLSAGERLDLDLGVQALLAFAPPATMPPGV
jgi:Domain of unknown function (DUF222)